jgi:hypothetical protein
MKRGSTLFLKVVLLLIALGVIFALIRFPQTEGRAVNLDLISIYADPLILYIYIGSLPFFVGLYQAFKLLHFIDTNRAFSKGSVNTLRTIKFVSLIQIGFIILGLLYIRFFAHGDDPAGPTMLGFLVSLAFAVIATVAAIVQKLLQNAVDIKSEHDLTV